MTRDRSSAVRPSHILAGACLALLAAVPAAAVTPVAVVA